MLGKSKGNDCGAAGWTQNSATCGWSQALCHEPAGLLLIPLYEALQQRDRQPVASAARCGGLRRAHDRAQLPAHQKLMLARLQLRISMKQFGTKSLTMLWCRCQAERPWLQTRQLAHPRLSHTCRALLLVCTTGASHTDHGLSAHLTLVCVAGARTCIQHAWAGVTTGGHVQGGSVASVVRH